MPTLLITAELPEKIATKLADGLMEGEHFLPISAAGAFEAAPPLWRFEAWSTKQVDKGDFLAAARRLTGEKTIGGFKYQEVNDKNWVKKSLADLPPVRAGRFVIFGAHDRDKGRENETGVEIEASLAFGTGHHPTTLGCLLELDRWCKSARVASDKPMLLDIGTGTGILALAAASALPLSAIASDLDKDAIEVARRHRKLAGLERKVRIIQARGTRHRMIERYAPYPLVIANILSEPLAGLAPSLAKATSKGGTLILSGILNWQARRVSAAYINQNFALLHRRPINEWVTLVFKKR
jgi:ribosomal protein L11 methyltransferase